MSVSALVTASDYLFGHSRDHRALRKTEFHRQATVLTASADALSIVVTPSSQFIRRLARYCHALTGLGFTVSTEWYTPQVWVHAVLDELSCQPIVAISVSGLPGSSTFPEKLQFTMFG